MIAVVSYSGLGETPSFTSTLPGAATGGAAAGVTVGMQTGSVLRGSIAAAGGALLAIAPATGPAAPFVAAAGALVAAFSVMFRGCGETCIVSGQLADRALSDAQNVMGQYFALPTPRPRSAQAAALAAVDAFYQALYDGCSSPALGEAGRKCIAERLVRGAPAPWCPTPDHTGCDWFAHIRDPIANDPAVYDDSAAAEVTSALASAGLVTPDGGLNLPILLALGLIVAGVAFQ